MTRTPVRDGLAFLTSTFRAEIDAWERRAYERMLDHVPKDVLMDACDALVLEAAAGRKFYPMPTAPEWLGACAKVIDRRRAQAVKALMAEEKEKGPCETCHGSRWVNVKAEDGHDALKRCECWLGIKRRIEAAGTRLELPPALDSERDNE